MVGISRTTTLRRMPGTERLPLRAPQALAWTLTVVRRRVVISITRDEALQLRSFLVVGLIFHRDCRRGYRCTNPPRLGTNDREFQ